jgi:Flp pilus assembly protein protease CpaA
MSTRWIAVGAGVVALLTLWAIWGSQERSLAGLVGLSLLGALALLALLLFGKRSPRSMEEVIHDIEGEPVLARAPRAGLRTKGDGSR